MKVSIQMILAAVAASTAFPMAVNAATQTTVAKPYVAGERIIFKMSEVWCFLSIKTNYHFRRRIPIRERILQKNYRNDLN